MILKTDIKFIAEMSLEPFDFVIGAFKMYFHLQTAMDQWIWHGVRTRQSSNSICWYPMKFALDIGLVVSSY